MGINGNFDTEDNWGNPLRTILQGSAVLAPIGVGAYLGIRRIQANEGLSAEGFGTSTTIGRTGQAVGKKLRAQSAIDQTRQLEHAKSFAEQLTKSSGIDDLLQTVSNHNAVIQSILTSLDDPQAGLDVNTIQGYKTQLMNLATDISDAGDKDTVLKGLIQEIFSNNDAARKTFDSSLGEFKHLGPQLAPPSFGLTSGSPFTPLDSSQLRGKARTRYERLNGLLRGQGLNIDFVQSAEHTGATGTYARVWAGSGNNRKLMTMMPLDAQTNVGAYGIIRQGEAGTAYMSHRMLIDAEKASTLVTDMKTPLTTKGLRSKGAIVDIEDFYLNSLESRINKYGNAFSAFREGTHSFNASMRAILTNENRSSRLQNEMGHHLRSMNKLQTNTALFVNLQGLSKSARNSLLSSAAHGSEFDLGVGAERLSEIKMNGNISSIIGLREGSAFSKMRTGLEGIFGIDRYLEPITARAEQVTNRSTQASRFIGPGKKDYRGPLSQRLGAGYSNIGWTDDITGGINKAHLLDVGVSKLASQAYGTKSGRLYAGGTLGSGQSFQMGMDRVVTAGTIPVLDPNAHGVMSSKLLNRIMANPDQMLTLTAEEIAAEGGFVGVGSSGNKFLPSDPRMNKFRIGYHETTTGGGKKLIHLKYEMDRNMETAKLFGRLSKGTVATTSPEYMASLLKEYNYTMGQYGIGSQNLVVGTGEALKKAPNSMIRQMMTGFGLVSGVVDYEGMVRSEAEQLLKGIGPGAGMFTNPNAINPIALTATAVTRAMGKMNIGEDAAGQVLAAVYNRGLANEDSWLDSKLSINSDQFHKMVGDVFGKAKARGVLGSAARGLAIGADTNSLGEGVGSWGKGQASLEVRMVEQMQQKLRSMGMNENAISDYVSGLYMRKAGYGEHLDVANDMIKMSESVKGLRGLTSDLPTKGSPARVTVEQILNSLKSGEHENLSSFFSKFENGAIVDLKGHSDSRTAAAMRAAAENTFGGQGEVYFPGGKTMQSMRSTFINTMEGDKNVAIGSKYEKLVNSFGMDLQRAAGMAKPTSEVFAGGFQRFAKKSTQLTASTVENIARGKVKGSAYMVAGSYDMTKGVGLTLGEQKLIQSTMQKTKGAAIFASDYGFLSMAQGMASSKSRYGGAKSKRTFNPVKETARSLQNFYTSMELNVGARRGVVATAVRQPVLSQGNVNVAQVFRHVKQARQRGDQDEIFSRISQTAWGQKALDKFDHKVRSFKDLATSPEHRKVKAFFNQFARNLDSFVGWEGGGQVFQPVQQFDVHYGNTVARVDFGMASSAFGDFDGDQWALFMADKRAGQHIMSTLKDPNASYSELETLYKIKSEVYGNEAKGALTRLKGKTDFTVEELAFNDALKEKASKEATGLIDQHLDELRRSVANLGTAGFKDQSGAHALMKVLEEHTTIKGKKLPIYQPFAEQLTSSIDVLMRTGDEDPFRHVVKNVLFKGSQLLGDGVTIGGISAPTDLSYVNHAVAGSTLSLDRELDTIVEAARVARSMHTRGASGSSAGQMANALRGTGSSVGSAFRDVYQAGLSLQTGMLKDDSVVGDLARKASIIGDQVMGAAKKLNRGGLAPVVAGLGVALGAGMLFGAGDGYHAQALMPAGEMISPDIRSAVANGQVMTQGSHGPMAADMQRNEDRYAMMNRPINSNTTYMNAPNSYNVAVEAGSPFSYNTAANYMSSMPGMGRNSTSVTVNDTRRPITRNYMDRLTGDY